MTASLITIYYFSYGFFDFFLAGSALSLLTWEAPAVSVPSACMSLLSMYVICVLAPYMCCKGGCCSYPGTESTPACYSSVSCCVCSLNAG